MKRLFTFFSLTLILAFGNTSHSQQMSDFDVILERVCSEFQSSIGLPTLTKEVTDLMSEIKSDGSWSDINYKDKSLGGWKPDQHIKRIGKLVRAYANPKSSLYKSADLHPKILNSIKYWINLNPAPVSDNWWWLSISVPLEVGQILTTMRFVEPGLPEDLEDSFMAWMDKGISFYVSPGKDGSNLTDIAQHVIMKAALTENSELLREAVSATAASIKITTGDGIQRDMSFHAHGPELYIHGYGREYLSGIRNVAVYINGTSFSFTKEQIAIISEFTRNGYLQPMRGRYIDYSVLGRGIARSNATRTNSSLVKQIQAIDIAEHRQEYQHAIDRIEGKQDPSYQIQPRNIHYWRSDYTVHHRPEFMVSLNIASSRTIRTESGNKENLNGQFLTEGAINIAVKGDEYFNVFPHWEWNKIPGTTTPENKSLRKRTNWVANPGNADFVGGVSDGLNGVAVYNMADYNTFAKKAWFFFDNKVICLGTEIHADRPENISTTINQSRLRGAVLISDGGEFSEFNSGSKALSKRTQWVLHDEIGYYFPENQELNLEAGEKPGAWSEINGNSSSKVLKTGIFKFWINHGIKPKNASYSYILVPGVKDTNALMTSGVEEIAILRNDKKIQAVADSAKSLMGAVFYEKGRMEWEGNKLEVSEPSLVQIQKLSDSTYEVSLSEPTQKITGKIRVSLEIQGKGEVLEFNLPEGDLAGSTVRKMVNLK